jgi:hypothetical protein
LILPVARSDDQARRDSKEKIKAHGSDHFLGRGKQPILAHKISDALQTRHGELIESINFRPSSNPGIRIAITCGTALAEIALIGKGLRHLAIA